MGDKDTRKEIKKYLKKYNWIKTDFYSAEEITLDSLVKDILRDIKKQGIKNIKSELKKIIANSNEFRKKKNELLKQQKLTPKDKRDLKYSEEILRWFDWRKLAYMSHFYHTFLLLNKIANRYGMTYHEISTYSKKEVENLLRNNKKVSEKILNKRNDSVFCVYEKNHKKTYFYKEEGRGLYDLATHVDHNEELKGLVASTGGLKKIEGNVTVVMHPSQLNFKKNDILVTSMTRVEFVPLMRKAKAVITDEGGVACHAAIVSRELGIPAIIGTKNATKLLNTKDKVEIDLKNGFIKILNN
jgi:phosphoenolpyruvate synthase/pyruvate phosphate dikinase